MARAAPEAAERDRFNSKAQAHAEELAKTFPESLRVAALVELLGSLPQT
ncbi:MAG: hypothetical protein ACREUA_07435 [Burkholderiales bacterium]